MISFLGVRIDTTSESSYGNMSAHKKFPLKAQNSELAIDRYVHPRMQGMYKKRSDCLMDSYEGRGYSTSYWQANEMEPNDLIIIYTINLFILLLSRIWSFYYY